MGKSIWDSISNALGGAVQGAGDLIGAGANAVALGGANLVGAQGVANNSRVALNNSLNAAANAGNNTSGFGQLGSDVEHGAIQPAVNTFDRAYNTVGAGVAGLEGIGGYGFDQLFGTQTQAQRFLNAASDQSNAYLNSGIGHQGGYLTPAQAASSGGGWQGLRQNFIAPVAAGVGDIAPYVVGGGEGKFLTGGLKGAAAKAGRAALVNGGVGAGASAAQQYGATGHVDASKVVQAGVSNAAVGGLTELGKTGGKALIKSVGNLPEDGFVKVPGGSDPTVPNPEAPLPIPKPSKGETAGVDQAAVDKVMQQNPMLPRPGEVNSPEPTAPSPAELKQSKIAADQANYEQQNPSIDYSKVQGAGKEYQQTVTSVAKNLREQDRMQNQMFHPTSLFKDIRQAGGIGSSDYEDIPNHLKNKNGASMDRVAQQMGYPDDAALHEHILQEQSLRDTPNKQLGTLADYKQKAVDYMHSKATDTSDPEGAQFADVMKRADAETQLKNIKQADVQSGYNAVKNKAPAGTARPTKGMTAAQVEKYQSPEFAARQEAGQKLASYKSQFDAVNKVIKSEQGAAKNIKSVEKLNAHNAKNEPLLAQQRLLSHLVRQYGDQYAGAKQALADKYPDTVLYQKGKVPRGVTNGRLSDNGTVPTTPIKGSFKSANAEVEHTPFETTAASMNPEDYRGFTPSDKPAYDGPNLNEGAFGPDDPFSPENMAAMKHEQELEDQGYHTDPETGDKSFSPTEKATPERNLAGDEAAFNSLSAGDSMEEAVAKYRKAVPDASLKEAQKAVNDTASLGQIDTEATRSKNPMYDNTNDRAATSHHDIYDRFQGYKRTLESGVQEATDAYHKLSEADQTALEHSRGVSNEDMLAKAENPKAMQRALDAFNRVGDYSHEIGRQNGSPALYLQNRRAGLHFEQANPEDVPGQKAYNESLDNVPGFAKQRNNNDYDHLEKTYGMTRKNGNILEDLQQDSRQVLNYVKDRSFARGLDDLHGQGTTAFGAPDFDHSTAIHPGSKVFTTPEIANEFSKVVPKGTKRPWYLKPYDAANSAISQSIVANFGIHGFNQLNQAVEAVGAASHTGVEQIPHLTKNILHNYTAEDKFQFFSEGNHSPSYGAGNDGWLARATKGVSKLNEKAMANTELQLRLGTWKTLRDAGLDADSARGVINTFMGDNHVPGWFDRNIGFFTHYFRTTIGSLAHIASNPKAASGSIVNLALMAAGVYGVNQGLKQLTGNQNASIHTPGNLGTLHEIFKAGDNLYHKHFADASQIGLGRINPLIKEGVAQVTNRDTFTGRPVAPNGTAQEHVGHLLGLTPETQAFDKVSGGSKSPLEAAANLLGVTTPHAKGYQAAPNIGGSYNDPNAKPGNGLDQQKQYFDALEKAKTSFAPGTDKRSADLFNAYIDRNGKPNGDGTFTHYKLSDSDKKSQAQELFGNDKLRQVIAQYNVDQGSKDPLYKLSDDKQKLFQQYESKPADDPQRTVLLDRNPDLKQLLTDRNTYFADNQAQFAGGKSIDAPGTPTFPVFTADTQSKLDQITQLSAIAPADKTEAQTKQEEALYNDTRQQTGDLPLKGRPQIDAAVQQVYQQYLSLPKGDGAKGGSPERGAFIKAHPDEWAKVQDYLAQSALYKLDKNASLDTFEGQKPNQQELGAAYSLGKYDIAKSMLPNGSSTFSLDPQAAAAATAAQYKKFSGTTNPNGTNARQLSQARRYMKQATYLEKQHPNAQTLKQGMVGAGRVKRGTQFKYSAKTVKLSAPTPAKGSLRLGRLTAKLK
jgi:hypothetical protein